MALPAPTIIGQGRVESELMFTWNGKGDGQARKIQVGESIYTPKLKANAEYNVEAYKITAIPTDGWKFDHWEYREEYHSEYANIQGGTDTYTITIRNNPTITNYDTPGNLPIGSHTEKVFTSSGEWNSTYRFRCVGLTAVFVPLNPVGRPLLVHDPVSRKLVSANNKLLNGM